MTEWLAHCDGPVMSKTNQYAHPNMNQHANTNQIQNASNLYVSWKLRIDIQCYIQSLSFFQIVISTYMFMSVLCRI
jgi:hypothetical protein